MARAPEAGTAIELGRVERLVALRGFPGAHAMASEELVALTSIAEPLRFAKGSRLVRATETVHAMFLVLEGSLRARTGDAGPERRVGPEGIVGVAHGFARDARGLECDAETEAVVLRIAVEDLEDLFEDHPAVLVLAARELGRRAIAEGHGSISVRRGKRRSLSEPPGPLLARPLDLVERVLALRGHAAIGAASLDGVAALARAAVEIRPEPGEVLWRTGEPSSSMLVVLRGSVGLVPSAATAAAPLRSARAGETAGELECIADQPRPSDAVAGEGLVALALDRDAMLDAWEDHSDLGVGVLRALGAMLVDAPAGAPRQEEARAGRTGGE